jgi:hypothetical protein
MARCIVTSERNSRPRMAYCTLERKPATSDVVRSSHASKPASVEVLKVAWQVEREPCRSEQAPLPRAEIRYGHDHEAAGPQHRRRLAQRELRVGHVLERMIEGDGVEATLRPGRVVERSVMHLDAQRPRLTNGVLGGLDPRDAPSAFCEPTRQVAAPAADVEEAPGLRPGEHAESAEPESRREASGIDPRAEALPKGGGRGRLLVRHIAVGVVRGELFRRGARDRVSETAGAAAQH